MFCYSYSPTYSLEIFISDPRTVFATAKNKKIFKRLNFNNENKLEVKATNSVLQA